MEIWAAEFTGEITTDTTNVTTTDAETNPKTDDKMEAKMEAKMETKMEAKMEAKADDSKSSTKQGNVITDGFTPGAQNVILNGPWVNFWCGTCGRKLASRSIYEHWAKSHGDKHYKAGLCQIIDYASSMLSEIEVKDTEKNKALKSDMKVGTTAAAASGKTGGAIKRASTLKDNVKAKKNKVAPKGPKLFGVRTQTLSRNAFFEYVDNTPEAIKKSFDRDAWMGVLGSVMKALTTEEYIVAREAIDNHFDSNVASV